MLMTKREGVKNSDRRREGDEEEGMGRRGRSEKGDDRGQRFDGLVVMKRVGEKRGW